MSDTNTKYLVWSNEHSAWWRPNGAGYTVYIQSAGRYSKEEAEECCNTRSKLPGDIPSEVMISEEEAYRNGFPEDYNDLKIQLEYLKSQFDSQSALIQKIMSIVEDAYPGERHSDYDVLHQGVNLLFQQNKEYKTELNILKKSKPFSELTDKDMEKALGSTKTGSVGNWIARAEKLRLDKEYYEEKLKLLSRAANDSISWINNDQSRDHLNAAIDLAGEKRKDNTVPNPNFVLYFDDRLIKGVILD